MSDASPDYLYGLRYQSSYCATETRWFATYDEMLGKLSTLIEEHGSVMVLRTRNQVPVGAAGDE